MRCLKCNKPPKLGHTLCAECLNNAALAGADGAKARASSVGTNAQEAAEVTKSAESVPCIKCSKPSEPGKVLCAQCLGKHDSLPKRELQRRERRKKSVLERFLVLLFSRFLTVKDAASIESRAELVSGLLAGSFKVGGLIGLVVVGYYAWHPSEQKQDEAHSSQSSSQASTADPVATSFRNEQRPHGQNTSGDYSARGSGMATKVGQWAARFTGRHSPDIIISEPANGSFFKAGDTLRLVAVPGDMAKLALRVRFVARDRELCDLKAPPFECDWGPLPIGNHIIHAQATDTNGVMGRVASVMIKVVPPAIFDRMPGTPAVLPVFLTQPLDGAHVVLDQSRDSTRVFFKGWVADSLRLAKVSARVGATSCVIREGVDFSGECSVAAVGDHTLTVDVTDLDGQVHTSKLLFSASYSAGTPSATQINPYYSTQDLYSIVQDWGSSDLLRDPQDSVAYSIMPEPEAQRMAPVFYTSLTAPEVARFSGTVRLGAATTAGSFDDYVAAVGTTVAAPARSWTSYGSVTSIPVQPRLFGFINTPPLPAPLSRSSMYGIPPFASRGISFLSLQESQTRSDLLSGRLAEIASYEREQLFLNTLSVTEAMSEAGGDASVGAAQRGESSVRPPELFTHYLAVTGGEAPANDAIVKLLAAGSFLPFDTKRLLKTTGNYGVFLQWLWRAALPYSDEQGAALPFSGELRHRSFYLSRGDVELPPGVSDLGQYRYNEALHMREMARIATQLQGVLPPVTILALVDYAVTQGVDKIPAVTANWDASRKHIQMMLPTVARVAIGVGEEISMRVALNRSYDLFGRPLTFKIQPLYPQHRSVVSIEQETESQFLIKVRYSADNFYSSIPLIATAANEQYEGAPAFINIVPSSGEGAGEGAHLRRNESPAASSSTPLQISARVGSAIAIPLTCSDPEGAPTQWIRWSDEPGAITDSSYSLVVPREYAGRKITLHFICSDGAGGYGVIERVLHVE
jgi:hypothetical protein